MWPVLTNNHKRFWLRDRWVWNNSTTQLTHSTLSNTAAPNDHGHLQDHICVRGQSAHSSKHYSAQWCKTNWLQVCIRIVVLTDWGLLNDRRELGARKELGYYQIRAKMAKKNPQPTSIRHIRFGLVLHEEVTGVSLVPWPHTFWKDYTVYCLKLKGWTPGEIYAIWTDMLVTISVYPPG